MQTRIEIVERLGEVSTENFKFYRGIVDNILVEYCEEYQENTYDNDGDAFEHFQEYITQTTIEDGEKNPIAGDNTYVVGEYMIVKYEIQTAPGYFAYVGELEILARSFTKEEYENLENSRAYHKEFYIYKSQEIYPKENFEYYQGMNRIEHVNNRRIQLLVTLHSEKEARDYFEQYIFGTQREELDVNGIPSYKLTEYWVEAKYTKDYYDYFEFEGPITIGIMNTSRSKEYEDRMEAERIIERTCLLERNVTLETTTEGSYYKGVCREVGGNDGRRVSVFKYFDTDEEALEAFQEYKDSTHVTNYDDTLQEIIEYSVERCVLYKEYWDDYILSKSHEVLAESDYTEKIN